MSNQITRKIRQLENQNDRLKKLLDAALQLANEDAKEFEVEAQNLKQTVCELEEEKEQLQNDLNNYLASEDAKSDHCDIKILSELEKDNMDMRRELHDLIDHNERKCMEIKSLKDECRQLQTVLDRLEGEKDRLLEKIKQVMLEKHQPYEYESV